MRKNKIKNPLLSFWKAVLVLTIILTIASMVQMVEVAHSYNINFFHSIWIILLSAIAMVVIIIVILFALLSMKRKDRLLEIPESITNLPSGWKLIAIIIFIILLPIYPIITLHPYLGQYYAYGGWTHLALFWWLSLGSMVCLKTINEDFSWYTSLWLGFLIMAVFYTVVKQFLMVTDYPFALTWSEAGRFYGASLFFSKKIYGVHLPLGIMHPTWHFLLAIPFLFGDLPIWLHRLWWALLQLVLGISIGWVLASRLKLGNPSKIWIVAGWVFIFLFPRPLLVHLLFYTLVVIWGVKPNNFWRTTFIVIFASIWAGLSRINWFPVPGIFAAILYLLEVPYEKSCKIFKYLWKPILWVVGGTLIALISNLAYIKLSGNGTGGNFTSSLSSGLLWYRLFPNSTYPNGILLDLLLLTGPVIVLIILNHQNLQKTLHPLRLAGIIITLTVLLAGGLVVSIKIGGGSDLHNLDAYLILLTIVGGYFFFGCYTPDLLDTKPIILQNPIILSLLLITPVWMIIRTNVSIFVWDKAQTDRTLTLIRQNVENISRQGGQVLFISQRHLLSLKMVNIPLVPEYEQDFLMEMVMSHNRSYLDQFQEDLRAQRFTAIVLDAQNVHLYGRTHTFGEENDLWVQDVSIPLLCYYEIPQAFNGLSTVVYVPRSQPCK